jgi:oxygen-independent coproporphyrinogen III oxidase
MPATLPPPKGATTPGNHFISNYPPFSCWNAQQIPQLSRVLQRPSEPGPLSLYIHIPFCRQRCHYCYFRVYPRRSRADVDRYIDSVLGELAAYAACPALAGRPFTSVYFGGGTPSYLDDSRIRRLLGGLQQQRHWDCVQECTFECEPNTVTREKLALLKELGVSRVSLGFQSLSDEVLRRSGRDVKAADCLRAFQLARAAGFREINIDLLAGLHGDTEESWQETVGRALELSPESITIYQLELTYNSGLYASLRSGRELVLPSWPQKRSWTALAFERCENSGYSIASGYLAVRDPSSSRFVYPMEDFWQGADLLGLGESAFGYIQGVHYQNTDAFDSYTGMVADGQLPLRRALRLLPDEKLRREIILQFKIGRLDRDYFRKKFHLELTDHLEPEFETLARAGLLQIDNDAIRLTRAGLLQVDWLLPLFYLPEHSGLRYT